MENITLYSSNMTAPNDGYDFHAEMNPSDIFSDHNYPTTMILDEPLNTHEDCQTQAHLPALRCIQQDGQTLPRSNQESRTYVCNQCGEGFTRNADLGRHQRAKHDGTRFTCRASNVQGHMFGCTKVFTRETNARKHRMSCDRWIGAEVQPNFGTSSLQELATQYTTHCNGSELVANTAVEHDNDIIVHSPLSILQDPLSTQRELKDWLYCFACGARREYSHLSSFLQHLLDHLENICQLAYRCPHCQAAFGLWEHVRIHCEHCKWTKESENICSKIQIRIGGQEYEWGCDIEYNYFDNDEDRRNHITASSTGSCSTNRLRILQVFKNELLHQLEIYVPILRIDLPEKGVVSAETLRLIRRALYNRDSIFYHDEKETRRLQNTPSRSSRPSSPRKLRTLDMSYLEDYQIDLARNTYGFQVTVQEQEGFAYFPPSTPGHSSR